jgi:hypothetical protein
MVEDALSVLRSVTFFLGLLAANVYVILQRKFGSRKFSPDETEGTAVNPV